MCTKLVFHYCPYFALWLWSDEIVITKAGIAMATDEKNFNSRSAMSLEFGADYKTCTYPNLCYAKLHRRRAYGVTYYNSSVVFSRAVNSTKFRPSNFIWYTTKLLDFFPILDGQRKNSKL